MVAFTCIIVNMLNYSLLRNGLKMGLRGFLSDIGHNISNATILLRQQHKTYNDISTTGMP